LELSLAPAPLPPLFDQVNGDLNATALIPPDLPDGWSARLARMLADDPQDRALV
jgi:hypothetical protein